jgi:ferric-dicitrate binding protein FerR (iron transport regulator)
MENLKKEKFKLGCLLLEALDGQATPKSFAQINEFLVNDPEMLSFYVNFISICSDLKIYSQKSSLISFTDGLQENQEKVDVLKELMKYEKNAEVFEANNGKGKKKLSKEECEELIKAFIEEEKRIREEQKARQEEEARVRIYQQRRIRMKELQRRERILQLQRAAKKTWKYTKVAAAAAVLALFAYVGYLIMQPSSVATLTDTANAEWENPDFSDKLESRLLPGPMKLVEGLAQITFDDGTEVIIEAPTEINLKKANSAFLELGKLSAKVPLHAQAFTINTPSASIVDLGTQFVVQVDEKGSSGVHVVKGKTKLTTQLKGITGKITQIVSSGQAKGVPYGRAVIESIKPETIAYIETIESKIIADTKPVRSDHKPVSKPIIEFPTLTYSQTILKYDPILYFSFDVTDKQFVLNRVNNAPIGQLIGQAFLAKTNASDNTVKNEVLKLNGGYVHIDVLKDRGSSDGYTFVMWIQPDITARQNVVFNAKKSRLDNSSSKMPFDLVLFIEKGGTLTLNADSEVLENEEKHPDDVSSIALRPGIWYHVAAVVTPDFARLYVDGILQEVQWDMPAKMADELLSESGWEDILIGASLLLKDRHDTFQLEEKFHGAIDEFAIYDRALSHDEITTLYRNSKNGN